MDYITKPFQVEEVYSRIKVHLELKDAKEEIQTLLTKTLTGSIKMMTELLSSARPEVFAQATRLKRYAQKMNEKLLILDGYKIELAAMLSVIGFVTLPEVVIEKKYSGKMLSVEEKLLNDSALLFGAGLIKNILRMEDIAEMILSTKDIKIGEDRKNISGKDILDVIIDYDNNLLSEEVSESAINKMMQKKSKYNQIVLDTFIDYIRKECEEKVKRVYVNDLKVGMVILEDILTEKNIKVVSKNTTVTAHTLSLISFYTSKGNLVEIVKVKEIRG